MKIRIVCPFTGSPGGVEKSFAAGQEIAAPADIDRKTAQSYVEKGLAVRLSEKVKKERTNGTR